jgi:uncharacterized protein
MLSFADGEKRLLLSLARRALVMAVERRASLTEFPEIAFLHHPGGAFVTLRVGRRLRGCIGRLPSAVSPAPLGEVVVSSAWSAALEDPRFEPVRLEELPGIEIELSILSPLFPISREEIVAGRHGLLVSRGIFRGVLLPQVATEFHWNACRFLEAACVKASLAGDAWNDPETRLEAFTAEVFSEAEFPAEKSAEVFSGPGFSHSSST